MNSFKRVKMACYMASFSMSVVANLPPMLFLTFHDRYGISYSLLGLLVLINFVTQLSMDLIFSLFSHRFDIPKCVKLSPILTVFGLLIFAITPFFLPSEAAYGGFLVGTVLFSASSGFCEALLSPVIAAIPSEEPEREMSKLHSIYAWGVVAVIVIATLFLLVFDATRWQWLMLLLTLVPLTSALLFAGAELPRIETPERISATLHLLKNKGFWLCFAAIFCGGAAECTMSQWASGYLERGLGIPKMWGDLAGVALFAVMLGLGRSLYAKCGKHIGRVLTLGAVGATLCYLTSALTSLPLLGLFACGFTGFCVSMLWPGSLIVASDYFPSGGVFIYAMMAAGGDLGASVGPQLIGVITDTAIANERMLGLSQRLGFLPEELGMKLGMLCAAIFPLLAIPLYLRIAKPYKKKPSLET